ncbi:metallophosphoesterase [Clostridium sp. SYSU_GA19001]|uniref:metallophosphoesterase family protein n=1 Tax=Clostridium caldaquaticum TaxID=2940653 RepID=UPI0020773F67|nr:metallophosphoesterase [Clostridium caldaquaticum]
MKILLVSDEETSFIWDYFDPSKFKDIDLIISCGDLKADYLSFLVTMIKAPLFYVPGNHDTNYMINPPEGCSCIDGKLVSYKGLRILGLGGTHKYSLGKYQYTEKQMRKRISKLKPKIWLNKGFDILVSHAPSYSIGDEKSFCHRGFKCFEELMDKYSPKYFFHGHVHLSYGLKPRINVYKSTKIINAFQYYIVEV